MKTPGYRQSGKKRVVVKREAVKVVDICTCAAEEKSYYDFQSHTHLSVVPKECRLHGMYRENLAFARIRPDSPGNRRTNAKNAG
jgi:hypothetical protein